MKNIKSIVIGAGAGLIAFAIYKFYTTQVKLLKNISYKIVSIKINKLTKELVSIDFSMRVTNYSNIDATIKEMFLDLFINNVKVGNIQEAKNIVIKSNGQTDISFTFNINPALILTNITSILNFTLAMKDAAILAKGYAKMESGLVRVTVPYEYRNTFKEFIKPTVKK
jgi:LEA14-like dessication related protein